MKTIAVLFIAAIAAFAQSEEPRYAVAIGAGLNQYSAPSYAMTGTFALRVGDGLYSLTSLDMGTRLDPVTKKRAALSTIRTGVERVITRQGPVTLMAHGDAGVAAGAGTITGAFSGGGTAIYMLPKWPNAGLYGTVRIIRNPDVASNPATVMTAFSFGCLWTFK